MQKRNEFSSQDKPLEIHTRMGDEKMYDFYTAKHSQQYSSSSRGGMGIQKTNYSLSPNHTTEIDWMGKYNYNKYTNAMVSGGYEDQRRIMEEGKPFDYDTEAQTNVRGSHDFNINQKSTHKSLVLMLNCAFL